MKGEALGLLHKTELSLVEVGIEDVAAAEATYARLRAILDAEGLEGTVVVQDLVSGLECFVGARRDPVFGPTVTFGLGGTLVEHERDVTTLLAPTDRIEVLAAVERLRGAPRFKGLRGDAEKDASALADIVVELSRRIASDRDLVEVDLNPVMVGDVGAGATAVDAVVIRH